MKKNAMLKIAAVVLCAVLLTTCAISTTFAKYVSNTSELGNAASARVAKWTVNVAVAAKDGGAFKTTYDYTPTGGVATTVVDAETKVVAPGTKVENAITITTSGLSEVAYKIYGELEVTLGEGWKDENGDAYCPLVFNVTSRDSASGEFTALESDLDYSELNEWLASTFAANADAATVIQPSTTGSYQEYAISWEWPFESGKDAADTALGNAAAAGDITISFTGTLTAAQYGGDFAI